MFFEQTKSEMIPLRPLLISFLRRQEQNQNFLNVVECVKWNGKGP